MTRENTFRSNMARSPDYQDGYRSAIKDAITWLHKRAEDMSDHHAKAVLNTAAFNMGNEASRVRNSREQPHD